MVYSLNKKKALKIFEKIFLIRNVEEAIANEYSKQEMRCPVHLSIGQEAVPAVMSLFLKVKDLVVSTHRGHAHYLGKGGNLKKMISEIYGKQTGCSKGKGGSMHLIDKKVGFYGTSAIVGNSIPVGVGLAYDYKLKKNKNLSVIYFGDGAVEEGVFFESLNLAAVKQTPTLFICENNLYSVYSPMKVRQPLNRKIKKMVNSIGINSNECDGNDLKKIFKASSQAINYIKKNNKPYFLIFNNYRWREHCGPNYDNNIGYRSHREFQKWKKRDPIIFANKLVQEFGVHEKEKIYLKKKIRKQINSAFNFAKKSKFPNKSELFKDIYK